jgi:hypothetical protein
LKLVPRSDIDHADRFRPAKLEPDALSLTEYLFGKSEDQLLLDKVVEEYELSHRKKTRQKKGKHRLQAVPLDGATKGLTYTGPIFMG